MVNLLPRLPEIKTALGLTDSIFGLVMASMGVGAIIAGPLPAKLIATFGPLKVALTGTCVAAVLLVIAGFAPHALILAGAFFLAGIADACIDAAQNTQGVLVENWSGRVIINSLHGTWSIGAAIAGLIGSAAAGLAIPVGVQASGVSFMMVALALICYRMGKIPEQELARMRSARARSDRHAPTNWRRTLPLVPLAVIALCGALPEDVAHNWGALYLVREFEVGFSVAGLGLVTMLVSQIIGRFTADALTERFGAWTVATYGSVLVAMGSLLIVLTPIPAGVYAGFVLTGYGCASLIPTAFAAAGRIPGLASGTGITLVSFAVRIALAGSSPLIGVLAERTDLRVALSIPVFAGVLAAILSSLRPRPGRQTETA